MSSSITSSPVQIHCKGILFDMDGILISSLESVERAWRKWAILRGVDPDLTCQITHGCRALDTIAKLRPDLDPNEEIKIVEGSEFTDHHDIHALPGAIELLAALPPDRWTVVTSARDLLARLRLKVSGIPAPLRIVAADHVNRGKPHPDPFLAGAALLGFDPSECVVFEDSASGAKAGRDAGCTVVATTFSQSIESLDDAHYLITGLRDVHVTSLPNGEGLTLSLHPLPS